MGNLSEVKDLGDGSCQLELLGAGLVPSLQMSFFVTRGESKKHILTKRMFFSGQKHICGSRKASNNCVYMELVICMFRGNHTTNAKCFCSLRATNLSPEIEIIAETLAQAAASEV